MPIDRIGQSSDPDRAAAVASVVGIGIVGVFAYYMLPMTIGAIADAWTLSAAEAGFIASAELAGMAVLSLTISAGIRKWNRRYMAAGCIAVMVLGNLLSMIASDAFSMGVCRFVAGCGEGGLMSMMSAGIANIS
jgi:predicted MFS family arabinose efflux permease